MRHSPQGRNINGARPDYVTYRGTGAQIRFTYHEFICAIKLCMQIYRTMNYIVRDMQESTTR